MYGCQKFHQYAYGRSIQVETDPNLFNLFSVNPLFKVPARIQEMLLTIQRYDLDVRFKQ